VLASHLSVCCPPVCVTSIPRREESVAGGLASPGCPAWLRLMRWHRGPGAGSAIPALPAQKPGGAVSSGLQQPCSGSPSLRAAASAGAASRRTPGLSAHAGLSRRALAQGVCQARPGLGTPRPILVVSGPEVKGGRGVRWPASRGGEGHSVPVPLCQRDDWFDRVFAYCAEMEWGLSSGAALAGDPAALRPFLSGERVGIVVPSSRAAAGGINPQLLTLNFFCACRFRNVACSVTCQLGFAFTSSRLVVPAQVVTKKSETATIFPTAFSLMKSDCVFSPPNTKSGA